VIGDGKAVVINEANEEVVARIPRATKDTLEIVTDEGGGGPKIFLLYKDSQRKPRVGGFGARLFNPFVEDYPLAKEE
jgi:hypothetical protein